MFTKEVRLSRLPKMQYNVNGGLDVDGSVNSDTAGLNAIAEEDRERLMEMNRVDIEFYDWARKQILSSLNMDNDVR